MRSDQVMNVKLCLGKIINVGCAYAPQVGCGEGEQAAFWVQVDLKLSAAPAGEKLILGGEREVVERVRVGWGVGERNGEGERVLDVAMAFDLAICNTIFKKREREYMNFKSGDRESEAEKLV
ncbi:uncharacterized protein LOC125035880 [Penaeus chinensis]|uniref:uncharacterized protein LOC125035880 n=1 Tax=Penaeus chinensis TaxID=139456 RepID=UPI001FB63829|nr:uncharacterized protein LOC125035880 [Penaeus chinensis]